MSLLTTVPNYPADQDMPFLLQVKFDDYAKRLAGISGEIGEPRGMIEQAADVARAPTRALLTRYVGLNIRLTELDTVLASAGVNSMWIRGEPGTGKTALADEFIRARTDKRLSSSMLGGPFFLFNVSLFLTGPPLGWVDGFNKSLDYVRRNRGLLIIDHIDDLVKASGEASDRIMQSLIACLEGRCSGHHHIRHEEQRFDRQCRDRNSSLLPGHGDGGAKPGQPEAGADVAFPPAQQRP
jgi:hypothetical protein